MLTSTFDTWLQSFLWSHNAIEQRFTLPNGLLDLLARGLVFSYSIEIDHPFYGSNNNGIISCQQAGTGTRS